MFYFMFHSINVSNDLFTNIVSNLTFKYKKKGTKRMCKYGSEKKIPQY